jgi:hypothetical protein
MDIDIDIPPNLEIDTVFNNLVSASMVTDGKLMKHIVGYYFQDIPVDNVTGLSAIPYKKTEDMGYYKIDFLPVHLLDKFESKEQMRELQDIEPDWDLLNDENVVKNLFHLGNHFDIISIVKPRSILELADVFALIRPNKRPLLYKYMEDPDKYRVELYTKRMPEDMRKAHAIPYAILIVLQLHLIEMGKYEIT